MGRETYERPWIRKFKSGEYLRDWKGYRTILIGGPYSENIGIGEEKFAHCMDFFCGIGDVDWWIASELDKLSPDELEELEWICKYKTYLKNVINRDTINLIASLYGCETFHVYRSGDKNILELIKTLNSFHSSMEVESKNCRDDRTKDWLDSPNPFKVMTFEEFKQNKDE